MSPHPSVILVCWVEQSHLTPQHGAHWRDQIQAVTNRQMMGAGRRRVEMLAAVELQAQDLGGGEAYLKSAAGPSEGVP